MMRRTIGTVVAVTAACAVWLAPQAATAAEPAAAAETGAVAAMQGVLRVERAGTFTELTQGSPLLGGDRLKTGPGDRAKLVFVDDSVIDMAPSTDLVLQTQNFDVEDDKYDTTLQLQSGKVRVALGERYQRAQNRYEVETPTAVALRGTEFIVLHSPATGASEIVAGDGGVEVLGKIAFVSSAVAVPAGSRTEVQKGKFPAAPAKVSEDRLAQYALGLEIVGTGRRDGLNVLHPLASGRLAAAQDVPGGKGSGTRTNGGQVSVGVPPESLAETLSADVRTNTQPLPEYRRKQPGSPLPPTTGGVIVDF